MQRALTEATAACQPALTVQISQVASPLLASTAPIACIHSMAPATTISGCSAGELDGACSMTIRIL